jgi:hypothetical protein
MSRLALLCLVLLQAAGCHHIAGYRGATADSGAPRDLGGADGDLGVADRDAGDLGVADLAGGDLLRHDGGPPAWLAPFNHRVVITIKPDRVDGTEPLRDFPLLVVLPADTAADVVTTARTDGADLLFTEADGITVADFEIEQYWPETQTLVAWVRLPELSPVGLNRVCLYFGDSGRTESAANPAGVWPMDVYSGVWHLQLVNGRIEDSTGHGHHSTTATGTPTQVASPTMGPALLFDGDDNLVVNTTAALELAGTSSITVEAWTEPDWVALQVAPEVGGGPMNWAVPVGKNGYDFGYRLLVARGDRDDEWVFQLPLVGKIQEYAVVRSALTRTSGRLYLAGTYDGSDIKTYLDGRPGASEPRMENLLPSDGDDLVIGGSTAQVDDWSSYGWVGRIDEVRVSAVARSAEWILTQHRNTSDPTGFYDLSPQSRPSP